MNLNEAIKHEMKRHALGIKIFYKAMTIIYEIWIVQEIKVFNEVDLLFTKTLVSKVNH